MSEREKKMGKHGFCVRVKFVVCGAFVVEITSFLPTPLPPSFQPLIFPSFSSLVSIHIFVSCPSWFYARSTYFIPFIAFYRILPSPSSYILFFFPLPSVLTLSLHPSHSLHLLLCSCFYLTVASYREINYKH